jgi:hypothetical protein
VEKQQAIEKLIYKPIVVMPTKDGMQELVG